MSYYSHVYRHRNRNLQDGSAKDAFFSKQNDTQKPGKKSTFFQAKLSVNEPGDQYEREADAVANVVVNNKSSVQTKPGESSNAAPANVSSQIENSSGKGNPLPKSSLNEMNSSFGVDFNDVKIHHGSDAVKMNNELQSQAFTHGRDIYFNQGKYQPETREGKLLLAHELTHVVQQGKGVQTKHIQRSFWGTVGGVLAGAAGGFLAGGPVGAVVGGVFGGVAGDAATTDIRGLNRAERQEAQKVFGNSLNYDAVRVSDSSKLMQIGGYARTPFNTIFFPTGTLGRSDPGYYAWLIHELAHTWQTQHGVSVFTKIKYAVRKSSYNFGGETGLEKAIKEGKCFNDFTTEAQGDILEKYYQILTGQDTGDGLLYYHFVSQVQNFGGKCEPAGTKDDSLDPKYRNAETQSNSFA